MRRSALWLFVSCAVGYVELAHAEPACTPADFAEQFVQRIDDTKCEKLDDAKLAGITNRVDEAKASGDSELKKSDAYLRELRALRDTYWDDEGWRAAMVRGVDAAIARARAGKGPHKGFANVRIFNPGVDPEECTFVVGRRDAGDYACFVLDGSPPPPPQPGLVVHVLPPEEAKRAVLVLQTVHSAISGLQVQDVQKAIERLSAAQERFDNLRRYGYLQYPWELAIDTALTGQRRREECQATGTLCSGEAGLDPAQVRAIFLHPGVGIAAPGFGFNGDPSLDTALALSLELAGFVIYNCSFEHYFGFSAGAIVNDGDFRDPRVGLFVHATRWAHVGYLVSVAREETRADASLFFSVDLGTAFGASFAD